MLVGLVRCLEFVEGQAQRVPRVEVENAGESVLRGERGRCGRRLDVVGAGSPHYACPGVAITPWAARSRSRATPHAAADAAAASNDGITVITVEHGGIPAFPEVPAGRTKAPGVAGPDRRRVIEAVEADNNGSFRALVEPRTCNQTPSDQQLSRTLQSTRDSERQQRPQSSSCGDCHVCGCDVARGATQRTSRGAALVIAARRTKSAGSHCQSFMYN